MALAHKYDGATLVAPTPAGSQVIVSRNGSQWQAQPATAVFMALPEAGQECLDRHKAFASDQEFQDYLKAHPNLAAHKPVARPISEWEKLLAEGMRAEHSDRSESDSSEAPGGHHHP